MDTQERLSGLPSELPRASEQERAAWSMGGQSPEAVVFPRNTQEVAEVLSLAHRRGWSVGAAGNGTFLAATLRSAPVQLVVSVRDLNQVTHYDPADLVLTAGAGTTLRSIQERVATERQFLALDPFVSQGTTIGAVASSGSVGPMVTGFGRTKDLILGATLVDGSGRVLKLGGRVVKNVAGFDVLKLVIGSGGRLGIITEVSARLHGTPAVDRVFIYRGELATVVALARAFATARVVPAALELVGPDTAAALPEAFGQRGTEPWTLLLRVMGNQEAVNASYDVFQELAQRPADHLCENDASRDLFRRLALSATGSGLSIRMSLPPAELPTLTEEADTLRRQLGKARLTVHASEGLARLEVGAQSLSALHTEHLALISRTSARLREAGGAFWLTAAPPEVLEVFSPRSDQVAVSAVQRRLLEGFDPGGVFGGAHGVA